MNGNGVDTTDGNGGGFDLGQLFQDLEQGFILAMQDLRLFDQETGGNPKPAPTGGGTRIIPPTPGGISLQTILLIAAAGILVVVVVLLVTK